MRPTLPLMKSDTTLTLPDNVAQAMTEAIGALTDDIQQHHKRVTIQLYGFKLVFAPDYVYYDDDTRSIRGVKCTLYDTAD